MSKGWPFYLLANLVHVVENVGLLEDMVGSWALARSLATLILVRCMSSCIYMRNVADAIEPHLTASSSS